MLLVVLLKDESTRMGAKSRELPPSLCTALPGYQDPEILGVCIAEIIHCALPAPDHRGFFFKGTVRGPAPTSVGARCLFKMGL